MSLLSLCKHAVSSTFPLVSCYTLIWGVFELVSPWSALWVLWWDIFDLLWGTLPMAYRKPKVISPGPFLSLHLPCDLWAVNREKATCHPLCITHRPEDTSRHTSVWPWPHALFAQDFRKIPTRLFRLYENIMGPDVNNIYHIFRKEMVNI